jgi:hypothetical protein
MKKLLLLISLLLCMTLTRAQSPDTLLRSAGFFLSPAVTDIYNSEMFKQPDPRFGFSAGYRINNKLGHGFFIEGGFALSFYGAKYAPTPLYYEYENYAYQVQRSVTQLNLSTPFLAGYQTSAGKVRFQTALGFAFTLQNFEFVKSTFTYINGNEDMHSDMALKFHPGFSLMARAGIRIPLLKRMSIDILPTARYRIINFTSESKDLRESIESIEHPWSVGLDVGLMFALDNKPSEEIYEYEYSSDTNMDFTVQYNGEKPKPVKKNLINQGPKNFTYMELAGAGMFYSINYERTVYRKDILSVQARVGFGYIAFANKYNIPLGANIALGTGRKKFETGIMITGDNTLFDKFNVNIVPSLAFRVESRHHFFLRLAIMSHVVTGSNNYTKAGTWMPGAGVSLGGCF